MDEDRARSQADETVESGSYVVQQGECVYSIAARTGHLWCTLWEHPRNEGLRRARKHPGVLLPGDRVHVPACRPKRITLESGRRYRVVVDGQTVPVRLRMCDADGEPMANAELRMTWSDRSIDLIADGDGCLVAEVPALTEEARLTELATGQVYVLRIGHLDPGDTFAGIRKRLTNLGYEPKNGGDVSEGTSQQVSSDAPDEARDGHLRLLVEDFCEDADICGDLDWNEVASRLEKRDPWTT